MVFRFASLAGCCALAASVDSVDDRMMSLISFASSGSQETDADRGILCSDGTVSGIYFLEASQEKDADKWLIWFHGGTTSSSKDWDTQSYPIDFHFGDEFATWNQIFFDTCSNDIRSGQRKTPLNGKYYQGHLHVVNGIAEMKKRMTTQVSKLLIGGNSAGSKSLIPNVDYIASEMPPDADVRVRFNSGLNFDVVKYPDFVAGHMDPWSPGSKEKAEEWDQFVDESCRAALGEDWYKCSSFQYAFPHISLPSFVSEAKYDKNQLSETMHMPAGSFPQDTSQWSKEVKDYLAYYGETAEKAFVEAVQGKEDAALFVPSCLNHCLATTIDAPETLTTSTGQSYTAQEAFLAWYHNTQTDRIYLDNCTDGLPCNPGADPQRGFSCASEFPSSECQDLFSQNCASTSQSKRQCHQCIGAHFNEFEHSYCTIEQLKSLCDASVVV